MDENTIKEFWNYYTALENQLQNTEQYVDHSIDRNSKLINGKTFSNEFAKILLLAASEFEIVGRIICSVSDVPLEHNSRIVDISKKIIELFPLIGNTVILTPYYSFRPLGNWKVIRSNGKEKVCGLPWWKGYNEIKHNRSENFKKANLSNCINAMASLTVLELYLSQKALGNLSYISSTARHYFNFNYGVPELKWDPTRELPDFQ